MHAGWKTLAIGLLLLCLLAAGIRLYRLGEMDTRGDEVELLIPPIADFGPRENFVRDWQAFKTGRILSLPRVTTSALVKGLGLPVNRFNIRLAYALVGLLTIPALFLLGWRLGDRRLAWILASLGTINPYLIFFAREAHVYAFPLLFNTWAAALACGIARALSRGAEARRWDTIWFCVASILACHTHMSSWALVGLLWVALGGLLFIRRRDPTAGRSARRLAAAMTIWLISIAPWIGVFISALFTEQQSFLRGGGINVFGAMWRLPFVMTWGGGMPRALLTLALLLAGISEGLISRRWRPWLLWTSALSLLLFGALSIMMQIGAGFFSLRYYTPLWLFFNILAALGVLLLAERLAKGLRRAGWKGVAPGHIAASLCLIVALFMARPIYWLIRLPGNPTPYSMVNHWMDQNLPKGTLVIVDRWLEPWNEMRYHAPSNVVATFCIPNEPQEILLRYNWPERVQDFFRKYPDAAYLELCKKGPLDGKVWSWPRRHFRHQLAFTNEPALALRRTLLAPKEDFYEAHTNRIVVELFFNSRPDAIVQARLSGKSTLLFYGSGWGYLKLWRELQDFRDWRVMEEQAVLDIYNLTTQTNLVNLSIQGMARGGSKRVISPSGASHNFKHLQLEVWSLGRTALSPGLNQITLRDPLWSMGHVPMLLDEVILQEIKPE